MSVNTAFGEAENLVFIPGVYVYAQIKMKAAVEDKQSFLSYHLRKCDKTQ